MAPAGLEAREESGERQSVGLHLRLLATQTWLFRAVSASQRAAGLRGQGVPKLQGLNPLARPLVEAQLGVQRHCRGRGRDRPAPALNREQRVARHHVRLTLGLHLNPPKSQLSKPFPSLTSPKSS